MLSIVLCEKVICDNSVDTCGKGGGVWWKMKFQRQVILFIQIINQSRQNALKKVNEELIQMYWKVGEYLSVESTKSVIRRILRSLTKNSGFRLAVKIIELICFSFTGDCSVMRHLNWKLESLSLNISKMDFYLEALDP